MPSLRYYHYTNPANLEQRVRFELTVLRICNPLHLTTLPPLHICSASPGGNYSTERYDAIIPLTRTFHPLPDRDRSRIASGLWVRRLPPVVVTLLLILRVTVSGDTRNVLAETVRFELTVRVTTYDRLATCCLRPLGHVSYVWCLHLDSNQEPSDYESLATNQLCYRGIILWCDLPESNRDAVKREIFLPL